MVGASQRFTAARLTETVSNFRERGPCLELNRPAVAEDLSLVEALDKCYGATGAVANTLAEHISAGQPRRLDVALGLVGGPTWTFLDGPTTGFDSSSPEQ